MNTLARVVHDLVTGEDSALSPHLTPLEQTALADLQPLLQQSPQKLSVFLAQEPQAYDWLGPGRSSPIQPDGGPRHQ